MNQTTKSSQSDIAVKWWNGLLCCPDLLKQTQDQETLMLWPRDQKTSVKWTEVYSSLDITTVLCCNAVIPTVEVSRPGGERYGSSGPSSRSAERQDRRARQIEHHQTSEDSSSFTLYYFLFTKTKDCVTLSWTYFTVT